MPKHKTKFDISVIIPTFNRSELLNYTLSSLVKQNLEKNRFEVIVSDDGSNDNTINVVRKYDKLLNLKYLYQENLGYRPGSARNKAILKCEGKLCLFIDSGVIVHSNCVVEHLRFHYKKKSSISAIGYVYGFDRYESEYLLKSIIEPNNPDLSVERLQHIEMFNDIREPHYLKYENKLENLPAPWFYFWTCHLSVKTKELLRVGLFDEAYDGNWGVEDNDLGFRLNEIGIKTYLLRSAVAIHYPHGKVNVDKKHEGYKNCVYFHSKFQTQATKIFLDTYMEDCINDINDTILNATMFTQRLTD